MGVLKANVGGSWVPVSQGGLLVPGGSAGQVLVKQSATDGDALWRDLIQTGAYTPTLAGITIGTGGGATNSARYTYVGEAGVGGKGIIAIGGTVVLGSSGFSVPGPASATMPSGFQLDLGVDVNITIGQIFAQAAAGFFTGIVLASGATTVRFLIHQVGATYGGFAEMAPTVPGTWAAANSFRWAMTHRAVRV